MKQLSCVLLVALRLHLAAAIEPEKKWDTGPELVNEQIRFWNHGGGDVIDISEIEYSELGTFAGLPRVECFTKDLRAEDRYDIAILGAPLDTTVTGRPGARYGPSGIRTGSRRKAWGYSVYTGRDPLHDWAKVVDCGDAPMAFLDNRAAIKTLDQAHRSASSRPAANPAKSSVPRIIALGGDHTTTLSALRGTHVNWGPVSVIHFDSHIDTWDPKVLGGGISDYAGLNHGTFLHIAHEENLILNSSIHAGIRAPLVRPKGDMRNDVRCGFETITAREMDKSGADGIIKKIRERVQDTKVYITVDIDVLDPAFAPATGTPEAGGWSTRELLAVIEGLEGLEVVGADVVEVSPPFDNHGETTALAAAEIVHALLDLMVVTPVKAAEDDTQDL